MATPKRPTQSKTSKPTHDLARGSTSNSATAVSLTFTPLPGNQRWTRKTSADVAALAGALLNPDTHTEDVLARIGDAFAEHTGTTLGLDDVIALQLLIERSLRVAASALAQRVG